MKSLPVYISFSLLINTIHINVIGYIHIQWHQLYHEPLAIFQLHHGAHKQSPSSRNCISSFEPRPFPRLTMLCIFSWYWIVAVSHSSRQPGDQGGKQTIIFNFLGCQWFWIQGFHSSCVQKVNLCRNMRWSTLAHETGFVLGDFSKLYANVLITVLSTFSLCQAKLLCWQVSALRTLLCVWYHAMSPETSAG